MVQKSQFILGLASLSNHDSSVALLKDGQLIAAAEEERFTRVKFDPSFPEKSIEFCLKNAGITINDVDHVGFFWQPWRGVPKRIFYALRGLPYSFRRGGRNARVLFNLFSAERVFRQKTGYKGPFHFLDHHLTHAASCYFSSGFEKSAILSIDGTGEIITCWLGEANANKFTNYKTVKWPHSLGHLYATATQYLGFKIFEDKYKVMGLSAYGKPEYLDKFRKIIKSSGNGTFEIDLSYTDYQYFKSRWYSDKWLKIFGRNRLPNEPINQRHKNIAASLQTRLEEVLIELAAYTMSRAGFEPLCLSGGVILNSLAVGKLARSEVAKQIYTSPVSGDAGCALGAAYYINNVMLGNQERHLLKHAFWGIQYSNSEIQKSLENNRLNYTVLENPAKEAADLLAKGRIIGWFQGRAELGQRALGNRSILADPRDKNMKDKINSRIKNREPFKPFAPSILYNFQRKYFDWLSPVPFMTEVHPIKEEKRELIPAVTHIDGTGRLQTVNKGTNPLFWNLIFEFYKLTGIPLVLNTSFNAKGEPIVNSPEDAIATFLKTGLDDLIIGKFLVRK